jgi:hypothetical protein
MREQPLGRNIARCWHKWKGKIDEQISLHLLLLMHPALLALPLPPSSAGNTQTNTPERASIQSTVKPKFRSTTLRYLRPCLVSRALLRPEPESDIATEKEYYFEALFTVILAFVLGVNLGFGSLFVSVYCSALFVLINWYLATYYRQPFVEFPSSDIQDESNDVVEGMNVNSQGNLVGWWYHEDIGLHQEVLN